MRYGLAGISDALLMGSHYPENSLRVNTYLQILFAT
jgi:hypothetical protein